MKTKRRINWLALAALGVTAIAVSYTMANPCYRYTETVDYCRNIIDLQGGTVSNSLVVGGLTCTLDTDSREDDLTGAGIFESANNTGWDLDLINTACRIAYDCPSPGAEDTLVQYDPTVGSYYTGVFGIFITVFGSSCTQEN